MVPHMPSAVTRTSDYLVGWETSYQLMCSLLLSIKTSSLFHVFLLCGFLDHRLSSSLPYFDFYEKKW